MAQPDGRLIQFVRTGELPGGTIDAEVFWSAHEHGLLGVLFDEILAHRLSANDEIRSDLTKHRLRSIAETDDALDAIEVVGDRLEGMTRFGVAKGLALSRQWYDTLSSRESVDVDIYVEPRNLHRIGDVIKALDTETMHVDAFNAMGAAGRNFEHSVNIGTTEFDVHFDIMNLILPTKQVRSLWEEHSVQLELRPGLTVWTLDTELSVVLTLLHGARDSFASLKSVLDLRLMMDGGPDWRAIERFIRPEGWFPIVSHALEVVCRILDRPNPLQPPGWWRPAFSLIWRDDLVLSGQTAVVNLGRRQHVVGSMLDRRHVNLTRALVQRIVPPRAVIESRHATSSRSSYVGALLEWRLTQRRRLRSQTRKSSTASDSGKRSIGNEARHVGRRQKNEASGAASERRTAGEIAADDHLAIPDCVLLQRVDDEMILLNVDTDRYFALDDVAARFVENLDTAVSVNDAASGLLEEFEVDRDTLVSDLVEVACQLVDAGLLILTTRRTNDISE